MKLDHFLTHLYGTKLSRREALNLAAKAGILGALSLSVASLDSDSAEAAGGSEVLSHVHSGAQAAMYADEANDVMFDVAAVEAGAWAPSYYGAGDQRGTLNEVTAAKTARALKLLDTSRPVVTYNLGDFLFNGFPAFRTTPPRTYVQKLLVTGYQPPADFGGVLQSATPLGPNKTSIHEERLAENATYQIATQMDNLNHIGVGAMFYNGFKGPEIASTTGTKALGNENMGPIITRGIVLDILGLKISQGATSDYFSASNGARVLRDNYRITVEDIDAALKRQNIAFIEPGDVLLFREGWGQLVRTDPERYLSQEPGIYLRETRYIAQRRPALVGSDTWGLEVLDPAVTGGNAFPCHQELLVHHGIRVGEGIITDKLVEDGIFEFVYIVTPQNAPGATCGSTPPAALGQKSVPSGGGGTGGGGGTPPPSGPGGRLK